MSLEKRTEFYLKVNVNGEEFIGLDLERLIFEAIEKKVGRSLVHPEEDVIVTPIEFYSKESLDLMRMKKTLLPFVEDKINQLEQTLQESLEKKRLKHYSFFDFELENYKMLKKYLDY